MEWLIVAIKVFVIFNLVQGLASLCVWVERKGSALIQDRIGANRAGAFWRGSSPSLWWLRAGVRLKGIGLMVIGVLLGGGNFISQAFSTPFAYASVIIFLIGLSIATFPMLLLGPIFAVIRALGFLGVINTLLCDAVKALMKEDFVPTGTSNFMHSLAPFMATLPVFLAFAVVPIAPDFYIAGMKIRPQLASLNIGVLFVFAMAALAVYGVVIAGWCSNNKYAVLGALRASAQMISYELALGLSLVAMVIIYGTLDIYQMVVAQGGTILGFMPAWGIFMQPLAFVIFFVAGMAETKRTPFDLAEAESELVAGYFTEYSGMKFLLFWLGEFAEISLLAVLIVLMFLGGWQIPFVTLPETWVGALIGHGVFMGKVVAVILLQIVIRWTLPRFRFDQLMTLGWKYLMPLGLLNVVIAALFKLL